ncbi:hypothetical protein V5O48_003250 [Marasmius crinis-equi]|uniref:REJ domain-containing protein n=1 Tax=Marasmius crinis-equi TaxID=585013 RepID=A0ABR3FTE5_9AGAR
MSSTSPAFSPSSSVAFSTFSASSSSSSSSYMTTSSSPSPSIASPQESKSTSESTASFTISEFTTLVSTALDYNPIFEPLAFPCRPESHYFSAPIRRPMKADEKVTVLKKIKSILLRESPSVPVEQPSSQVPELPRLPLPPPSDPLFTPHMPLPLALERGLVSSAPEPIGLSAVFPDVFDLDVASEIRSEDHGEDPSEDSKSCSSSFHASPVDPEVPAFLESASDSSSSASCAESSVSHASSSLDLTSDPTDPFAKGHVQVVRRSTGSAGSCISLGEVAGLSAYSLGNHPYATTRGNSTVTLESPPKRLKRKKLMTEPPMPPPSCPLPPPPVSVPSSSRVGSLPSDLSPLPPLLPMPTRPLPPTPCITSPRYCAPNATSKDWTLDLPLEASALELARRVGAGVTAVGGRRRKVSTMTRRARRTSLQRSILISVTQTPIKTDDSPCVGLRPGHRRKGSPFPLLFEAPPTPSSSPLSTPTTPTLSSGAQSPSGSPQKSRTIRPPPLSHTLVLSPSGLPIPPLEDPDAPVTPTSECTSIESGVSEPATPPFSGRANVPGWFLDASDASEEGDEKFSEEHSKTDVDERYWTAFLLFWIWRIVRGNAGPPRVLGLTKANRALQRFSPWQIILSTLTAAYAMRNLDKIVGLSAPEPLARLYSPAYYRATWVAIGLDAGFATALSIRPKWLRDLCSVLFSVYYIIYANEADEKLRRFRAVPTVEMLRATWEKTSNPYIRLFTSLRLPSLPTRRKILLPRPKSSQYQRPITAHLFYALPIEQLRDATELILDFPGGGFICMTPEHHEERLALWAVNTRRPVLSIDYGKAPEYPYPFAVDEAFDTYRILVESNGAIIGMSGHQLEIVITGDSAGCTMAANVVIKTLEHNAANPTRTLPMPLALLMNYAALDFNFASWMTQENLRILRSEQSSGNLYGLAEQKDHLSHISPLSMVDDSGTSRSKRPKRQGSWRETIRGFAGTFDETDVVVKEPRAMSPTFRRPRMKRSTSALRATDQDDDESSAWGTSRPRREQDKPLQDRVKYRHPDGHSWGEAISSDKKQKELSAAVLEADEKAAIAKKEDQGSRKEPLGTRLTLTSRTGYFQDRIVTPSMMRAMALLYVGPYRNPDFATNYYISPLLAPSELLAKFPPLLLFCGEADPFNDDSILLAGRVREAKRARKIELDLALSGKSARFGEDLRMSMAEPKSVEDAARMQEERDRLGNEDDWVQLTLFAGWSHGYLQMSSLMWEAKAVIEDQADCIDDAFTRYCPAKVSNCSATISVNGQSARGADGYSAESEADEFGITFVTKKYQGQGGNGRSSDKETGTVALQNPAEDILELEVPNPDEENGPKPGRPTAGHKISETELMRRRRLLDAHMFE